MTYDVPADGRQAAPVRLPIEDDDWTPHDPLPDGYSRVPADVLPAGCDAVPGGLRLDAGILATAAGCWHGRLRNTRRSQVDAARWLWIDEVDPRAVARYRRRAWLAAVGDYPPAGHRLDTSCGDARCISPYHLRLVALPPPRPRVLQGGRMGWISDVGADGEPTEYYGWIPDRPCAAPVPPCPSSRPAAIRGAAAPGAKLTEADVRAIRAAANGDRRHGSSTSQKALARRFGISKTHVSAIVHRQAWAHVT